MDIQDNSIEEYKKIARDYWKRYAMARNIPEDKAVRMVEVCMMQGSFKGMDALIAREGGMA